MMNHAQGSEESRESEGTAQCTHTQDTESSHHTHTRHVPM